MSSKLDDLKLAFIRRRMASELMTRLEDEIFMGKGMIGRYVF